MSLSAGDGQLSEGPCAKATMPYECLSCETHYYKRANSDCELLTHSRMSVWNKLPHR